MKRLIIAAALAGTTLAGIASAQSAAPAAAPARGHRAMALDLNKDGIISRAEVTAAADARFAQLDANRDGKISASERPNKRGADKPDMTRDQLRQNALARFDRADGNKDGKIEQTERQAMRGKRGDRPGRGDGPGRDGPSREGRHGGRHGGGMGALTMADANRDGVITRTEATAAAQTLFDRVDTNRDGRVDQAERQAARGAMKMRRGGGMDAPDAGAR
jgi:hypothetical protein